MFLSGFEWFLSVSECSLSGLVRFWVVLVGLVLVLSVLEWFLSVRVRLELGLGYIDKCEECLPPKCLPPLISGTISPRVLKLGGYTN